MKKDLLIEPAAFDTVRMVWVGLTTVNQIIILSGYGGATLKLITEEPEMAEIICGYQGGGPSWSKNLSWNQTSQYVSMVEWIARMINKVHSGYPEMVLQEFGHLAQTLILINTKYGGPHQSGELFVACTLIAVEEEIRKACHMAISHAGGVFCPDQSGM